MGKTAAEKAAKKARRKAKRKARRQWFAKAFNLVGPLAKKAVLQVADGIGGGDAKAKAARKLVQQWLDAAIVLPEPWESASDLGIKALGGLIEGAIENAFEKAREEGKL